MGDPKAALSAVTDQLRRTPVSTGEGVTFGPGIAMFAVYTGLSQRARWPELADAIAAARRAGARLLVAGDPLEPMGPYFRAADGLDVDWRLGYLPTSEVDRALGEATVAVFPYEPELDQSGALLRALGAGVPAVAYDVGGIAEPVRRFGAGRVVEAGDVEALGDAVRELLDDPAALTAARAGARRAREELTWDASARAHLDLYEKIA
jgi:glycosyltransferase involved in cell wall biosynthesis